MKKITLALIASLGLISALDASTLSEKPTSNSLIVYNSNIGLVHEERKLSLSPSDASILYKGVASTIETDSVNVELPKDVIVYSQQYRYDKLTRQKLLDAHIGKTVKLGKEDVELLSYENATCLVKSSNGAIMSAEAKDVVFQTIPEELITKPSLVWNIKSASAYETNMKMDYIIKNITWKSDYVLNLDANKANLSGWISVNNNSGKAFKETQLYVLAGDVNRANGERPRPEARYMKAMMDSLEVEERSYEGYHLYAIPFKVNLANQEKTELKFISENSLDVSRKYSATLANPLYMNGEIQTDVSQYAIVQALDVPLPKGVVRTYSKLQNVSMLLGETSINHTPKNTPIELKLGKNFDLKVTQTVLKRNDDKNNFDVDVEYKVQNSSDEEKTVELLAPFNNNRGSKIETKQKYKFTKGNLVTFSVKVQANSFSDFKVNYESKR